jgi:cation:H+ antiporter
LSDLFVFESYPPLVNAVVVIIAIIVVALGADKLVEAASRIAKRLGISELVIGLTIVAFGTSAPEFAVTLYSAFEGQSDISVGNIVGSNIFNLGFILGGCALAGAIPVTRKLLYRDGAMLGVSTLLILGLVGWDLRLDRYDGFLLFALLIVYLIYLFRNRHAEEQPSPNPEGNPETGPTKTLVHDSLFLFLGLLGIVGGSFLMVDAATALARSMGVSDWVIAVTIVAAGTSAPEFATSMAGVLKGRYAISAGNLIGSDIFNLLGVLGIAGILHPLEILPEARTSLYALSAMVFLVLVFIRTGWKITRIEGAILVIIALLRWIFDFSNHA